MGANEYIAIKAYGTIQRENHSTLIISPRRKKGITNNPYFSQLTLSSLLR